MLRHKGFSFFDDEFGYAKPAFLTVIQDNMLK